MLRMRMRGEGDLGCCVAAFAEALTNVHTRQAGRQARHMTEATAAAVMAG